MGLAGRCAIMVAIGAALVFALGVVGWQLGWPAWVVVPALVLGGLGLAAGLLTWAYTSHARWTGLVEDWPEKKAGHEYVPGKTLWDWLGLLLIPATFTFAVLLFNSWEGNRERERADRQRIEERDAAKEQARVDHQILMEDQRENALQSFFDDMSDLILNHGLAKSTRGEKVRIVARTRTLATLRRLYHDGIRKGSLVGFLAEADLLKRPLPKVSLKGADLSGAIMPGIDLRDAYLRRVNLLRANLWNANLRRANLSGADLKQACLPWAQLDQTVLDDAVFEQSDMSNVTLDGAHTRKRKYDQPNPPIGVDFSSSFLESAVGLNTRLGAADFSDAWVSAETKIENADLTKARPTQGRKELEAIHAERWKYCRRDIPRRLEK